MDEQRRGRRIAMSDAERDAFLGAQPVCRVATAGSSGPHVTPLWFHWDGSLLWLYSLTRAQRYADLAADGRVAVVVDAGDRYEELRGVELSGAAETVGEVPRTGEPHDALAAVELAFARKYQVPVGGPEQLYHDGRHAWLCVTPRKISSWDFRKLAEL